MYRYISGIVLRSFACSLRKPTQISCSETRSQALKASSFCCRNIFPQKAIQVLRIDLSLLHSLSLSPSSSYSFFRTDFWRIVLYALPAFLDIKDNTLIHPLLPLPPQAHVFRDPCDPSAAYTARCIHQYSCTFSASGVSSTINYYILPECRPTAD